MQDLSSCLRSMREAEACATAYITQPGWYSSCVALAWLLAFALVVGYTYINVLDFVYLPIACRLGWAHRTTSRRIKLHPAYLVLSNGVGILSTLILPISEGVRIMSNMGVTLHFQWLRMLWTVALHLLLFDAWYYWAHRVTHKQKWLYRNVHADHHQHIAMMEARTSLVFSVVEGIVLLGIPNTLGMWAYVSWYQSPDILHVLPAMLIGSLLAITAHIGVEFHSTLPFLAMNPLMVTALVPGTFQRPYDHQLHHEYPNKNFALIFKHWDDWLGTAAADPTRRTTSALLMAYNLAFYAGLSYLLQLLPTLPVATWVAVGATAALLAVLPLPGPATWLQGCIADTVSKAYGCSVAGPQAALDAEQRYIFCYHSPAALPRGFWCTFMMPGSNNPLAAAGIKVTAGVAPLLLRLPVLRQVLALLGCCPASPDNLKKALHSQSVAVCLEAPAVQESGKGVPAAGDDQGLKARLAPLVQLAEDTGAVLVPVVALGEETASRSLVEALLMPAERIPTKVVVGRPLESPALRLADSASDITPVKDQGSRGQSKGCAKDARVAVYLAALQRLLKESAPQTVAPARGDTKVSLLSAQ